MNEETPKRRRVRKVEPKPASSYNPLFLAALTKGGIETVRIECESHQQATKLVQELYLMRKQMRAEKHKDYLRASRAKISNQVDGKRIAIVTISPYGSEFNSFFQKAGFDVERLKNDIIGDLASEQGVFTDEIKAPLDEASSLDPNLLANLLKDK